jgi:hypothetical protein
VFNGVGGITCVIASVVSRMSMASLVSRMSMASVVSRV